MAWAQRQIPDDVRGLDFGTQADFGTAPVSLAPVAAAQEITHETKKEPIERMVQKTALARGPEPFIPGPQSGAVAFKLPVRGGKLAAGGLTTADWLALAQYCGMTKTDLPGAAGVITGPGVGDNQVEGPDASLALYKPGMWILIECDGGGTPDLQMRMIVDWESAAGTTTLTVSPEWNTNPVAGDDIYDLHVLTPTIGQPTYLGLDVFMGEGGVNRHRTRYEGCAGTFKLPAATVGEIPMAEFNFLTNSWVNSENSRDPAEDAMADPRLLLADQLYIDNECIDFENLGFDPGTEMVPMPGQCLATGQGKIGWFHRRHVPVMEFQPYWDDEWYSLWASLTKNKVVYFNVSDSEDAWGWGIPAAQVVAHDPGAIADGLVGSAVEMKAVDAHEGSTSGDLIPLFSIAVTGTVP